MYRPPEMTDLFLKMEVSEKVDIWMLGCILYILCFFKHPFQDASKLAIINASYHISSDHNFSQGMIKFIEYLLATNPKVRPNIKDVIQIIVSYQKNGEIKILEKKILEGMKFFMHFFILDFSLTLFFKKIQILI